jgi:pimeloyl-ACP methyl ester carboxylesterase
VVLAPDHFGNAIGDLVRVVLGGTRIDVKAYFDEVIEHRPADLCFLVDELAAGRPEPFAQNVQRERVGLAGHSFGGWTALATTARAARVAVSFTMCSAGGPDHRAGERLLKEIDFEWDRVVPALFVAAARDSVVAIESVRELFARVRAPKKLVVLENADHYHFCDHPERVHEWFRSLGSNSRFLATVKEPLPFAQLCPAEHGHDLSRALALAQFEAFLKDRAPMAKRAARCQSRARRRFASVVCRCARAAGPPFA